MPDRILGCVLAGGEGKRFGADKAHAMLDGRSLLDRAVATLSQWCESVVVVGRTDSVHGGIPDWPAPGLGPLAGLAGALRHAGENGFSHVLSSGVDSPNLPDDLAVRLHPAPACLTSQPVVGLWPVSVLSTVEDILAGPGRHSLYHLAERTGATMIELPVPPANINTPDDLALFRKGDTGR